nr:unnamed protein product [Callosobruchus analis]
MACVETLPMASALVFSSSILSGNLRIILAGAVSVIVLLTFCFIL